jgi:hypothetical protein
MSRKKLCYCFFCLFLKSLLTRYSRVGAEIWAILILLSGAGAAEKIIQPPQRKFWYLYWMQRLDGTSLLNGGNVIFDSATWYSTHTCSTLRGSTLEKMFPYKNFYFKWGQYTSGAHFPSVITTIMDHKVQLIKTLNLGELYTV